MTWLTTAEIKTLLKITVTDYDADIDLYNPIAQSRVEDYILPTVIDEDEGETLPTGYTPYYARYVWLVIGEAGIVIPLSNVKSQSFDGESVSYGDTKSTSFVNPAGGTTTLDADLQPVYIAGSPLVINGNFVDLSPTQIAARQQIQDDSRYKAVIQDNTSNRTILATWEVTIGSVVYEITGRPRKPQFSKGWITVYLKKKGA